VFASAAARDAAVTSPQEGNFAYLKDTNVTTYYTGSAWANLDTTGMTNPMTTTGDTIYSSSGSTPARLGIGSTGQVLTVAGGVPSWATASSGALTKITSGSFSAVNSFSVDNCFSATYKNYRIIVTGTASAGTAACNLQFRTGGSTNTTANYIGGYYLITWSSGVSVTNNSNNATTGYALFRGGSGKFFGSTFDVINPFATEKTVTGGVAYESEEGGWNAGGFNATTSFDGFLIKHQSGAPGLLTGTYIVYGYGD
jgi:hypothetical protein